VCVGGSRIIVFYRNGSEFNTYQCSFLIVRDRETRKSLEGLESLDHQEIKIMPQSLQEIKVTEQGG